MNMRTSQPIFALLIKYWPVFCMLLFISSKLYFETGRRLLNENCNVLWKWRQKLKLCKKANKNENYCLKNEITNLVLSLHICHNRIFFFLVIVKKKAGLFFILPLYLVMSQPYLFRFISPDLQQAWNKIKWNEQMIFITCLNQKFWCFFFFNQARQQKQLRWKRLLRVKEKQDNKRTVFKVNEDEYHSW